jgi:transposase
MRTSKRLIIPEKHRKELESILRNGNAPQKLVLRAGIVLLSGAGTPTSQIISLLRTSNPTITRWRTRYETDGVAGLLNDRSRPGRKKRIEDSKVREVVERTLREKPLNATHWSTRSMAIAADLSPASVQRIWKEHGLKPHLVRSFKLSRDPHFIEKLHDVVGLYLNPPEHALVFSVDEKSQIQALDRTQPGLPMKRGQAETVTHDYKRNGTTTLFAALNTLDGKVIGQCLPRHRHQEFLKFLRIVNKQTPKNTDLHLILDNYSTHNHPAIKEWMAKHPRFIFHFVPTSSSWLNMVERWFGQITEKRIRRGVFPSVPILVAAITDYIDHSNLNPKPFVWSATVKTILKKIKHANEALDAPH